jgi:hypothetical protein
MSNGSCGTNDRGNFLAASNSMVDRDAATTEALAIAHGLYLANQLGVNKVMIQYDCLEAVETTRGGAAEVLHLVLQHQSLKIFVFMQQP